MKFIAQIKSVSIKETVSNDKEAKIVILTSDMTAVQLQEFIAAEAVEIDVKEAR